MTNEEQEDLTAELLATNQALVFIMRSIAALAEKEGIQREVFFRIWLENGMQAMARTRLVGIPLERQERVLEKARARYEEVLMACAAPSPDGKARGDQLLALTPTRAFTFLRLRTLSPVLSMTEAAHGDGSGQEARR